MLVGLTLLILGVITIFSLILGGGLIGTTLDNTYYLESIVNGSTTTVVLGGDDVIFAIDPAVLGIGALAVIIGIAVVLGVQAFASGLSVESIRVILACIMYGAVWILLSIYAMPLISAIEVFGVIIYTVLLIGYLVGVIQNIVGGEVG